MISLRVWSASDLREKFLDFFKKKGHKVIPSASLVPENDPTVLFTTAGMHPLVPYLLGENHPEGKRLCNIQPCLRTDDIDEIGDDTHLTFFEMLGNWSLGDYWKGEAIKWSYEFLTKELEIGHEQLAISCFTGDNDAPRDTESAEVWKSLGIKEARIAYLPKEDNWWGPAGLTGPCGPDTEMFIWTGRGEAPEKFDSKDKSWIEVWNDVFMEYYKERNFIVPRGYDISQLGFELNELSSRVTEDPEISEPIEKYRYNALKQKNVDTGLGLERMLAVLRGEGDMYKTELFWPIIKKVEGISGKKYDENKKEFRIIADHIKAVAFMLAEDIEPSNKLQGYVLRRLIRRAIVKGKNLEIDGDFLSKLADEVFAIYPDRQFDEKKIKAELQKEEEKFRKTLDSGLELLRQIQLAQGLKDTNERDLLKLSKIVFDLHQTYGFPKELSYEYLNKEKDLEKKEIDFVDRNLAILIKEHREKSHTASSGMFKGGLADNKVETTRLHTAAHLLLAALREVLGEQVEQKGSNITTERLRFDFNNPEKLTPEQIEKIENIVNEKINEGLSVAQQEMSLEEAKKTGATGSFSDRYGEVVKIYTIGSSEAPFSREICGGPHVKNTGELGHFKIIKEESSSSGIRRIKAVLE